MYIINGVAYAHEPKELIQVQSVKVVGELCLLLTFVSGEKRVFDASFLLEYPVYEPLADNEIFNNISIEGGTVIWQNGDIDIAPETLYEKSYKYEEAYI